MASEQTGLKVDPRDLLDALAENSLFRTVGVPDSTLEPLMEVLLSDQRFHQVSAVNECEAVSIAMGQFLATGAPSVVYLQNSGFGKTIHPITSLLTSEICAVPALLLIGWRGFPDSSPAAKPDEPQHVLMGRILPELLKTIEVPFEVLEGDASAVHAAVSRAVTSMKERSAPYALIAKPGTLTSLKQNAPALAKGPRVELTREQTLELLLSHTPADTLFVSTTGKASRELYFLREKRGETHEHDLYVVGGMGCASSIALGLALGSGSESTRLICTVDGDGAALMQLGTFASIGHSCPKNLLHLLIDNETYESTGGQPSISPSVNFPGVARACGYPWARETNDAAGFVQALSEALSVDGPRLLAVKTSATSNPKLGRPSESPRANALGLMRTLKGPACPPAKP